MENRLVMRFTTEVEGKYFSLTIQNIKEDGEGKPEITEAQVTALMDLIAAKNIFDTKNGAITGKKDAKVVSTSSTEYEF
ncbi:DUF2922 domain-containing protein [Clostridium tyrobutyricum]|uniref:DUF2922 domain-containing protein n=1 Tax=Clostridium tyrobutyricum TaxID=1519 RepID=UPI001C38A667|nr:DUF2922 domain-containing protein [Clostridium tyrobutyricum]MBV4414674.1 DUF2922 domain-containing protein [Clostridium tyrobutyricum]